MTNELATLEALRDVLIDEVNPYLPVDYTKLSSKNVLFEFPDSDTMPSDVTVFINGNYAEYEELATINDSATFTVSVFLIVKRDTKVNLTRKMYTYFNGIYQTLRSNLSLNQTVDFTRIPSADFYPAIEADKNVQGVDISVEIHYTKDF